MKATTKLSTLVITAAVLSLSGCGKDDGWFSSKSDKGFVQEITAAQSDGTVAMLLPDFTQLVEREGQAVVNIQAIRTVSNPHANLPEASNPFPEGDPFYDFFRRLIPNMPDAPTAEEDAMNFGSGFIISKDGYILTNTHVVSGSQQIKVMLTDKREYPAKLIGQDLQSDVALLKIEAEDLPIVAIGAPADLKVGEWVAAIGAPFGFENSVTSGIVSAKGRSLPNENYTPFIQTDVAINPGNSGGPLFNLRGQVIGINSQIYSRSGGFMGISFAIPIDIAMNVAEQLKTTGKVHRGQLGIMVQEVSYDLAKSFGLDKPRGALIAKVMPDSAAAAAKLKVGDIILGVNDRNIESSSDLPVMVGMIAPGQKIKLSIWRAGKAVETTVLLSDSASSSGATAAPSAGAPAQASVPFAFDDIGLTLSTLTVEQKQRLGTATGVIVTKVQGWAKGAGLMEGDIILQLGTTEVDTEQQVRSAIEAGDNPIPVFIRRGGSTLFLPLRTK
ncbi:MAG: DegQ family serine endoprotease [Neisseriaceae bacterium]|nr:DegQ family serine endoprotease [Neisseriaceae bacterium]